MNTYNPCVINPFEEITFLVAHEHFDDAENKLVALKDKTAYWHYLYSKILIHKSWFDSAKWHLEEAIKMDANNDTYDKALIELMARNQRYRDGYSNSRRRNSGLDCCCCCDDCCEFSCCDLICLDTCCECMGGDLIECI